MKALVVEDEGLVAIMVEQMLEDLGIETVTVAGSIDEAVPLVTPGAFAFALLDVNLDGKPSHPVAQALRGAGVPFILSTGYGAAGADGYGEPVVLQKPFELRDLHAAIRTLLPAAALTDPDAPLG